MVSGSCGCGQSVPVCPVRLDHPIETARGIRQSPLTSKLTGNSSPTRSFLRQEGMPATFHGWGACASTHALARHHEVQPCSS